MLHDLFLGTQLSFVLHCFHQEPSSYSFIFIIDVRLLVWRQVEELTRTSYLPLPGFKAFPFLFTHRRTPEAAFEHSR